ncbi:MAG: NUDIX hydrolase [Candidatus Binatia bacterium]
MSEQRNPRQAATVILLRETEPKGFEAFLTRRPDDMPFLGGMYCYPGGSVSKDDFCDRIICRCAGLAPEQARKIVGAQFNPTQALGFWVAAIRELFEEVGVLLAANAAGERSFMNQSQLTRLAEKHNALLENSLSFADLLESEDLLCDLTSLGYFSHWQTPAQTSLRFDTRFFVAALPREQTPLATSYEVAHSLWLPPDRAMQLHERGELPMIFPTFASLRTLADFETLESVSREFGIRRPPFSSEQR